MDEFNELAGAAHAGRVRSLRADPGGRWERYAPTASRKIGAGTTTPTAGYDPALLTRDGHSAPDAPTRNP